MMCFGSLSKSRDLSLFLLILDQCIYTPKVRRYDASKHLRFSHTNVDQKSSDKFAWYTIRFKYFKVNSSKFHIAKRLCALFNYNICCNNTLNCAKNICRYDTTQTTSVPPNEAAIGTTEQHVTLGSALQSAEWHHHTRPSGGRTHVRGGQRYNR